MILSLKESVRTEPNPFSGFRTRGFFAGDELIGIDSAQREQRTMETTCSSPTRHSQTTPTKSYKAPQPRRSPRLKGPYTSPNSSPRRRTNNDATPPSPRTPRANRSSQVYSPGAGLRMLSSLASPELKAIKKEEARRLSSSSLSGQTLQDRYDPDDRESFPIPRSTDSAKKHNRKDKSLGLLSENFLRMFDGGGEREVCLDEVAKDLSVERRRIYDIVNVLEGVEVVVRKAKNKYTWLGLSKLDHTLEALKNSAADMMSETATTKPSGKGKTAFSRKVHHTNTGSTGSLRPVIKAESPSGESDDTDGAGTPGKTVALLDAKRQSLGILAQRFIMMFFYFEKRDVSQEQAADLLVFADQPDGPRPKTKVRRLYDIANILCSLNLIEKISMTDEQRGRKPGFKWVGPQFNANLKECPEGSKVKKTRARRFSVGSDESSRKRKSQETPISRPNPEPLPRTCLPFSFDKSIPVKHVNVPFPQPGKHVYGSGLAGLALIQEAAQQEETKGAQPRSGRSSAVSAAPASIAT